MNGHEELLPRTRTQLFCAKVSVYRGTPMPDDTDADLKNGVSNISVYSISGMTRNTMRFACDWTKLSTDPVVYDSVFSGSGVTFSSVAGTTLAHRPTY